jgi:adenylyltransferase/sulfurtransferase
MEISVQELKAWKDEGRPFQLIDVREPYEFEWGNIDGAENIPLDSVLLQLEKISKAGEVIIHCKSGNRASAIIDVLKVKHGYTNLRNLTGGIEAWATEIDSGINY